MKVLLVTIIFAGLLVGQEAKTSQDCPFTLEPGANMPACLISTEDPYILLPDVMPYALVIVNKEEYKVAYSAEQQKISLIITEDRRFKTSNNLRVGKCLDITKDDVSSGRNGVRSAPETPDGWRPVLGYYSQITSCNKDASGKPIIIDPRLISSSEKLRVRIRAFMK